MSRRLEEVPGGGGGRGGAQDAVGVFDQGAVRAGLMMHHCAVTHKKPFSFHLLPDAATGTK